jgi:hypothetical protein
MYDLYMDREWNFPTNLESVVQGSDETKVKNQNIRDNAMNPMRSEYFYCCVMHIYQNELNMNDYFQYQFDYKNDFVCVITFDLNVSRVNKIYV